MQHLLIGMIHIYWRFIPLEKRRHCLFHETCSQFVYRITKEKGFMAGIKALQMRIKTCNPQHHLYQTDDGTEWVILADKSVWRREDLNI